MIPTLTFGRTGHESTRILFGAAALGDVSQSVADETMRKVMDYGINHIDTAASYGEAELRLGPWMEKHRDKFFLATKTGDRGYADALESIRRSREKMRTEQIDMIQFHAVIEDDEWEAIFKPGGALEAAVEAREKGWVRFIGITSHSLRAPMMHQRSLERFDFDAVLLPYNYMLMQNAQYAADFNQLMKTCREKSVAVQLIKTNQRRKWEDQERFATTWYDPFVEQDAINQAIGWAMGTQPHSFLNSSGDVKIFPKFAEAGAQFDPQHVPSAMEMEQLMREKETVALWP